MTPALDPALRHVELPHTTAAVPLAREVVRNALDGLTETASATGACDTAELLTAELVANAVQHTPGAAAVRLTVRLLCDGTRETGAEETGAAETGAVRTAAVDCGAADCRAGGTGAAAEHPDEIRVEVRDDSPTPPAGLDGCARPEPGLWDEDGRGLLLVHTLSGAYGSHATAQGKAVWFTLALSDRPA